MGEKSSNEESTYIPHLFSEEEMIDQVLKQSKNNNKALAGTADMLDKIGKGAENSGEKVNSSSIIARARKSVLQFPIYITQTIPVNEAQVIANLFERVYATLVQTVLSQNTIIDEDEANNLVFLKKFHTNIKESADVEILAYKESFVNEYYKPIDDIDAMIQESVFYQEQLTPNCEAIFKHAPTTNTDLIAENTRLLNEPLSGLSYLSEEQSVTYRAQTLSEKDLLDMAVRMANLTDDETRFYDKSAAEIRSTYKRDPYIVTALKYKMSAENKVKKSLDKLKADIKANKINGYSFKAGAYYRLDKTRTDNNVPVNSPMAPRLLLKDADIKKINGMLPYTMEATFRVRTKENGMMDVTYVLGIKSVMHVVSAQDLVEDLRDLVTGNIKSLRKVRYKTGEIGFVDYLFNVNQIKKDAAKSINYNKRWVNTLKRLAEYNKLNGSLLSTPAKLISGGDIPIPNGTLVLSQSDVTMLTNQTGIDLSAVSNAKRLAKSLFLIAVVIVDPSAGSMKVLFPDSDNSWDVQSLASIDAEVSRTDNSSLLRELNKKINMI